MKKTLSIIFLILIINPICFEGRTAEPVRPENRNSGANELDAAWRDGYAVGKAVSALIPISNDHSFIIPFAEHRGMLFYETFSPSGHDWKAQGQSLLTYGKPVDITKADDGKTITVKYGTIVRIKLESQPALHAWSFVNSTNLHMLIPLEMIETNSFDYTQGSGGKGYVGNTIQREYRRLAIWPGVVTLDLRLMDKTEGNENSVIDSFRVEIITEEAE